MKVNAHEVYNTSHNRQQHATVVSEHQLTSLLSDLSAVAVISREIPFHVVLFHKYRKRKAYVLQAFLFDKDWNACTFG